MKSTLLLLIAAWLQSAGLAVTVSLERVSVDSNGRERSGSSVEPAISGDGSVVVFTSTARFTTDLNGRPDVFAKDRATGQLLRVSDERGGDQPSVSADGVFIVYRSLEDLPKVRKLDRRTSGPRNSVSFPFGGAQSRRFGDAGVLTPNGAWTAYIFRPEPANTAQTRHLVNRHSTMPGATFDDAQQAIASGLRDAARAVSNNAGTVAAWVSSEPFALADTNDVSDVFIFNGVTRLALSALPGNLPAAGRSYDVAFSADDTRCFFLSDAALVPADTDGRTSIYFASAGDGFAALTFLPTSVQPIALGPQAASAKGTVAFTALDARKRAVLQIANLAGVDQTVSGSLGILGAPALSADGSTVAFATKAALSRSDRNTSADIYVADVASLFATPRRAAPVPVFTNVVDGQRINGNQNFFIASSASDPNGTISEMAMELDGVLIERAAGSSLSRTINVPPGSYTVTVRAYNDAYVAAEKSITIVALPSNGTRGLAGAANVSAVTGADGSLTWSGAVRIENRTASARNFRVSLIVAPAPAIVGPNQTPDDGAGFSDVRVLPEREETVGFVSGIINVAANSSALAEAAALLPPPEVIGNGLQGIAWTLIGVLTEELPGGPVLAARQILFTHAPVLSEKTNGPNGGATDTGNPITDTTYTPRTITQITLNVPPRIAERTTRLLTAQASFSDGSSKPCTPVWQIIAGGTAARVTSSGTFTAANIASPATVRLRATFPGADPVEATTTVFPVVPAVSIVANDKTAAETGDPGQFRIARSTGLQDPLTIHYTVGGTAVEGADYAPLPRSVTLPPGVSRAFVNVAPIDNAQFGGLKTVSLSLAADSAYRLGSAQTATARITDDEPPLDRQVDLVLRAGKTRVGIGVFETPSALTALSQTLTRSTRAGRAAAFALEMTHRGTAPGEYVLRGAPDFTGFTLQYRDGSLDVTAAVTAGGANGYIFTLAPGGKKVIAVRVTTTTAAPPRFLQRLPFDLRETAGDPLLALSDAAELVVFRR